MHAARHQILAGGDVRVCPSITGTKSNAPHPYGQSVSGLHEAEASDASPTSKVNTYALIGLVSAAITLFWNPFGLPAIAAVIAGAVGFVQGKGMRVGRGASVAAIVVGVLGIAWAAYYYSI